MSLSQHQDAACSNQSYKAVTSYSDHHSQHSVDNQNRQAPFQIGQFVWIKMKGHPMWPGTILELPAEGDTRFKYHCDYFNSNNHAKVPKKDLFDFIASYGKYVKKPLTMSTRDGGIRIALERCPDGVLEDEKKMAGIEASRHRHLPLIDYKSSEHQSENESHSGSSNKEDLTPHSPGDPAGPQKPGANKEKFTQMKKEGGNKAATRLTQLQKGKSLNEKCPPEPITKPSPTLLLQDPEVQQNQFSAVSSFTSYNSVQEQLQNHEEDLSSEHSHDEGNRTSNLNSLKAGKCTSKPKTLKKRLANESRANTRTTNVQPAVPSFGVTNNGASADKLSSNVKNSGKRQRRQDQSDSAEKSQKRGKQVASASQREVSKNVNENSASLQGSSSELSGTSQAPQSVNSQSNKAPRKRDQKCKKQQKTEQRLDTAKPKYFSSSAPLVQLQQRPCFIDLKSFADFLRLIVSHFQAAGAEANQDAARSCLQKYYQHLDLVKQVSELLWFKHDWYTLNQIQHANLPHQLNFFVTLCEGLMALLTPHQAEHAQVRRLQYNLTLLRLVFENIVVNQLPSEAEKVEFLIQKLRGADALPATFSARAGPARSPTQSLTLLLQPCTDSSVTDSPGKATGQAAHSSVSNMPPIIPNTYQQTRIYNNQDKLLVSQAVFDQEDIQSKDETTAAGPSLQLQSLYIKLTQMIKNEAHGPFKAHNHPNLQESAIVDTPILYNAQNQAVQQISEKSQLSQSCASHERVQDDDSSLSGDCRGDSPTEGLKPLASKTQPPLSSK